MSENANESQKPEGAETQNKNDLPEWGRKAISEANAEAAKYRIKANDIEATTRAEVEAKFNDQLKTLSDEKSAIAGERDSSVANYNKLVAALAAGVPGESAVEFASLLQGENTDEYKVHAEKLLGMFGAQKPPKAYDPSHGASSSGGSGNTTDDAWAQLMKSAGIK